MTVEDVLRSIEKTASRRGFPIIGPDRGKILDEIVREHRPKNVLEIGTLVGYSAIRMARLLPRSGKVTCIELDEALADVARSNLSRARLGDRVEVLVGDAKDVLPRLRGPVDMVFLDANKDEYLIYLKACEGLLQSGSVVVADNVKVFADRVADYLAYVRSSGKYASRSREAPLFANRSVLDAVEISVRL